MRNIIFVRFTRVYEKDRVHCFKKYYEIMLILYLKFLKMYVLILSTLILIQNEYSTYTYMYSYIFLWRRYRFKNHRSHITLLHVH